MAEQTSLQNRTKNPVDVVGIIRDVMRSWQIVLLIAIAAGLFAVSIGQLRYHPTYTAQATMYVTRSGSSNVYNDIYSSSQVASQFSEILNSRVLKKKVAEEIGLQGFIGTAEAKNVENTNFVTIRVTTDSPEISFREIKSILENYGSVSDYVMKGIILKELEPPSVPSAPDQNLYNVDNWVMGFIGGALVMIALLAMMSYMRDTIRDERDVEDKLDTILLAKIPHEVKYHTLKEKIQREKKSILITDPSVSFRYAESMDRLARRVKGKMDDRKANVLLVCSVMENEGKSSVAANLALAMTKQGERVILLDADFRKPSQYKILGFSDQEFASLGDVLTGTISMNGIIRKVPNSMLYCGLNRSIIYNSSEVITSQNFHKVLEILKSNADYIIMDSSPMALVSDAEELILLADAGILVVRQNVVEAEYINDSIDALNAGGDKLLGCVFNDVYPEKLGGFESYGYSYHKYGYGGAYERG